MTAGGGLNAIYTHYNSNNEDLIFLSVDVSSRDDSAKIVDTYKSSSGVEPLFPIVLTTGNSLEVTKLFGKPTTGGPSFLMHPDREFTSSSYNESGAIYNIDKALEDDCNDDTPTQPWSKKTIKELSINSHKGKVLFNFPHSGEYTIQIFDIAGRLLYSVNEYYLLGEHHFPISVNNASNMRIIIICGNSCSYTKRVFLR